MFLRYPSLIIALAVGIAYANSLQGEMLQDDYDMLVYGWDLKLFLGSFQALFTDIYNTRGFTMWTFAVNSLITGTDTWGYHLGNLLIHLSSSLLVFQVVQASLNSFLKRRGTPEADAIPNGFDPSRISLVTAVIFGIHPLQTQAVTYLSQRSESLMGLLFLLALYLLIQADRNPSRFSKSLLLGCSIGVCLLGMRTKEIMIVAPLLILWYDRVFLLVSWKRLFTERGLYHVLLWSTLLCNSTFAQLVPTAASSPTQMTAVSEIEVSTTISASSHPGITSNQGMLVQEGARLSRWQYFQTQPGIILTYLRLTIWPDQLCFDYGHLQPPASWIFWSSASLLTLAFLATIVAIGKAPEWGFLGAWFFVNLGPRSSIIPLENPYFEYRMYLPILSVILLLVLGLDWFIRTQFKDPHRQVHVVTIVTLLICLGLGARTIERNALYADRITLWRETVKTAQENWRAYSNLTRALVLSGQQEHLQQAVLTGQQAVTIAPESATAALIHALALQKTGQEQAAIAEYLRTLSLDAGQMHAYLNLGNLYSPQNPDLAIEYYQKALEITPNNPDAICNMATTMLTHNREAQQAKKMLLDLMEKYPRHLDSRINLAIYFANQGNCRAAVRLAREAQRINPNDPQAKQVLQYCQQSN